MFEYIVRNWTRLRNCYVKKEINCFRVVKFLVACFSEVLYTHRSHIKSLRAAAAVYLVIRYLHCE